MESLTVNPVSTQDTQCPVYALLRRVSMIDFPGRLCRVCFIAGCNLRCGFCHNGELLEPKEVTLSWSRLEEILLASKQEWVDAVCITGGEPTLHPHLPKLVFRLKSLGFKVKLDTNGSYPQVLRQVLPLVDYVAMDYKAPLERYPEITGTPGLEVDLIRESVRLIMDQAADYEFRTTVVEGLHGEQDMLRIFRELAGARRYVLQAYVPPKYGEPKKGMPSSRTTGPVMRAYHETSRGFFDEPILRGK